MNLDRNISRGIEVQCGKCAKRVIGGKKDERAISNAEIKIPYMIDQPTTIENIRQKICTTCGYKIAYYTGCGK